MIRVIAIDDEPVALSIIEEFCRRIGDIDLKTFNRADEGMAAVQNERPDLLLLDIRLGDADGVRLAAMRPENTALIFTTAYTEYAVNGFNLDAVDYLQKPFPFERFKTAIGKAIRRQTNTFVSFSPQTITVKAGYRNLIINLADICYVEARNNYVCINLSDGKQVTSQITLTTLLNKLPKERFVRIHRSFVVGLAHVASYNRRMVIVNGYSQSLPIGRTYAVEIDKCL